MKTFKNRTKLFFCFALLSAISFSSVHAMPPDPSNAGLIYYQAFLMQRKTDADTLNQVKNLAKGEIEPDEKLIEYLDSNKTAIRFATIAADMPICDWGLNYSDGFSLEIPYLSQARNLAYMLIAQARVDASKGDYDTAIERCLTTQKMADHTSQSLLITYLVGYSIKDMSNNCLGDILGQMQTDAGLLEYLKTQLDVIESKNVSFRVSLEFERTSIVEMVAKMDPNDMFKYTDGFFEKGDPNEAILIERINSADRDFFDRNIDYVSSFLAEYLAVPDLPYNEAYTKTKELADRPAKDFKVNPDVTVATMFCPSLVKCYNYEAKRRASSNATRAAVSIYVIAAKTGQLPESLPEGLPKDPYSGLDFDYQLTDQGFVLRCQGENLYEGKTYEYSFNLAK